MRAAPGSALRLLRLATEMEAMDEFKMKRLELQLALNMFVTHAFRFAEHLVYRPYWHPEELPRIHDERLMFLRMGEAVLHLNQNYVGLPRCLLFLLKG